MNQSKMNQGRKAAALVKRIIKSRILTRAWNVHRNDFDIKNPNTLVYACGPITEIRKLKKEFGGVLRPGYRYEGTVWSYLVIKVGGEK